MFTVRVARRRVEITAPEIPTGRVRLEARLAADGAMTLTVNGQPAAKGQAPGLIANQPSEDLCVGHDNGKPVGDYDGKALFQGVIANLRVAAE